MKLLRITIFFSLLLSFSLTGCSGDTVSQTQSSSALSVNQQALEAYQKVLFEGDTFGQDSDLTFQEDVLLTYGEDTPLTATRFALSDLDGGGTLELIVELSFSYPEAVEIFYYANGKVKGEQYSTRMLTDLKSDGTFAWSNGIADNGWSIFTKFAEDLPEERRIARLSAELDESSETPNKSNESPDEDSAASDGNSGWKFTYLIDEKVVSEQEYLDFVQKQNAKQDIAWQEYSEEKVKAAAKASDF
jgi:hypothetical protein